MRRALWCLVLSVLPACTSPRELIDVPLPEGTESMLWIAQSADVTRVRAFSIESAREIPALDPAYEYVWTFLYFDRPLWTLEIAEGDVPLVSEGRPVPNPSLIFEVERREGDTQGEVKSALGPVVEELRIPRIDPIGCIQGGGCYLPHEAGRACVTPCSEPVAPDAPAPPQSPELPRIASCPSGWVATETGCAPWTTTPICDGLLYPGLSTCIERCSSWPDDLPADTVYVDANATPGGTGSRESPFTRIGDALTATVVAIAAGTYVENLIIARDIELIGECGVEIQGGITINRGTTKLRGLSIHAEVSAVRAGLNTHVEIDSCTVSGNFRALECLTRSLVSVTRSELEGGSDATIAVVNGSTLSITQSEIDSHALQAVLALDPGTHLYMSEVYATSDDPKASGAIVQAGASATIEKSSFEGFKIHSVWALENSELRAEELHVRTATRALAFVLQSSVVALEHIWIDGRGVRGMLITANTNATISDVGISACSTGATEGGGIVIVGAQVSIERILTIDCEDDIVAREESDVRLRDLTTIHHDANVGHVSAFGGRFDAARIDLIGGLQVIDVASATVTDIRAVRVGGNSFDGIEVANSKAKLARVVVSESADRGIVIAGGKVRAEDIFIERTARDENRDRSGAGLLISNAQVEGTRLEVTGAARAGIELTRKGVLTFDHVSVHDAMPIDLIASAIVVCEDCELTLSKFALANNAKVGVDLLGAPRGSLSDGRIENHAVGLRISQFAGDLTSWALAVTYARNDSPIEVVR